MFSSSAINNGRETLGFNAMTLEYVHGIFKLRLGAIISMLVYGSRIDFKDAS